MAKGLLLGRIMTAAKTPIASQVKSTNAMREFLPLCLYFHQTMRFDFVTNAWIHHVTSLNSKNFHFNLFSCKGITLEHVTMTAPDESPNTDGIHMALSSNIIVRDSVISTGDNCLSLGPGGKNIEMTGIACGPRHGISVGILGGTPDEASVTTVSVRNCTFTDTEWLEDQNEGSLIPRRCLRRHLSRHHCQQCQQPNNH